MYFAHTFVAAGYCFFLVFVIVHCQLVSEDNDSTTEGNLQDGDITTDDHSFVALIDIVFTDGSKKTCTGSIIHDNVVITAAHCFVRENHPNDHSESTPRTIISRRKHTFPELTASFVVIGTKKMFESGYEQYLPIERISAHPKFKGWTADLILVYTFAAMTSDKPGSVIPLAKDNYFTPVDSNLTVYSWGRVMELPKSTMDSENCDTKSKEDDECEDHTVLRQGEPHTITTKFSYTKNRQKSDENVFPPNNNRQSIQERKQQTQQKATEAKIKVNQKRYSKVLREKDRKQQPTMEHLDNAQYFKQDFLEITTKRMSRYLAAADLNVKDDEEMDDHQLERKRKLVEYINIPKLKFKSAKSIHILRNQKNRRKSNSNNGQRTKTRKLIYNNVNWRRMGSQQNNLSVDLFSFINVQTCKKILDRTMPAFYGIKDGNEIVCYSSERRFLTIDDSGAPVVQQGHLVAVTVGGVQGGGNDHIAVGMKMSCFCTWIAANLPGGGEHLQCCKNCCDISHTENKT